MPGVLDGPVVIDLATTAPRRCARRAWTRPEKPGFGRIAAAVGGISYLSGYERLRA